MEYVRLRDLVSHKKGFAFKSELYSDSGTMVVRVSDFTLESISDSDAVYIEPSDKYEPYRLSTGDILIQTVGSWANNPNSIVGKVVRVPQHCHNAYLNQNIVRIEPNDAVDKTYLFYSLLANHFSIYCVNRGQGAANQASITLETILKFKFQIHDKSTQTKIASILFKYDQLIENNNRRIRLLEQMAENLYKEWFVRFRFPGHEKVEMENRLPKGWKIVRLKDVIIEQPKSKVQVGEVEGNNGQYPFYTSGKNILKYNNYLVDGENILLNTGGIADVKYSLGKTHYSTDTWCIKAIKQYTLFLYLYLQEILPEINASYFEGAALKHLKKASFKKKKLMLPPSTLVEEFDLLVSVLYKEIFLLKQNTQLLSRQRDLLLPRLMSGKLEVNA